MEWLFFNVVGGNAAMVIGGPPIPPNLAITGTQYSKDELRAAVQLSRQAPGRQVVLRDPVNIQNVRTSDLLVDGVPYDIYTPGKSTPVSNMVRAMRNKNSQAEGIVLDLSKTAVYADDLKNLLARVQGAGGTNIKDIIVLW